MKITNIKYDIVSEENDYSAESRAQKMREMANELRVQRDKAKEVYEPATQEIGWKKVQVFLDNIEKQIGPLLFALRDIERADGKTGRYSVSVFTPEDKISRWDIFVDDNKIEIEVKTQKDYYSKKFPDTWVNENGEPAGNYSAEAFYGGNGIVTNTDFSEVLKEIDKTIEEKYKAQLNKMRDKQKYYENTFKKMANTDKDASFDALIRSAEKRAEQNSEKSSNPRKDFIKAYVAQK